MSWEREDTERWLNDYPLPKTFVFRGQRVWPRYHLKKGYGFWLRTAGPYHPALRGLFALCHELITAIPVGGPMPTPEDLAAQIERWDKRQLELPVTAEDQAPPEAQNPAEDPTIVRYEPL